MLFLSNHVAQPIDNGIIVNAYDNCTRDFTRIPIRVSSGLMFLLFLFIFLFIFTFFFFFSPALKMHGPRMENTTAHVNYIDFFNLPFTGNICHIITL
jgi:hypothetical protein